MNFLTMTLPSLATLSLGDIKIAPEFSLASKLDWRKVPSILEGTYPKPTPKAYMLGSSATEDRWWLRNALKARYVTFDVETVRLDSGEYSGEIFQVGMYYPGGEPAIWDRRDYPTWDFISYFRQLITVVPMVAHNASFDVSRLENNWGCNVWEYKELHDTILAHALLYSEFPHRLEFLASVYSELTKLKQLGVGNIEYLVGDVVSTSEAYEAMLLEFKSDKASEKLYHEEMLPLLRIVIHFMNKGVPVNQDFVAECLEWIPEQLAAAQRIADAYAGYPVSIESGPQMRVLLDSIEDVFGAAKKLADSPIKRELTPAGELSLGKETVTALRDAFLATKFNEQITAQTTFERIAQGGHPLLEAKALWQNTRVLLSNYLKPLLIPLTETEDGFCYDGKDHVGGGSRQANFEEAFGGRHGRDL